MDVPLVFVCSENDFYKIQKKIPLFQKLISKNIVIISKAKVKPFCKDVTFYDEDNLINYLSYENLFNALKNYNAEKRTGWYFQQFLKMAYAEVCEEPNYLVWDADTIPLHEYNTDNLLFDVKTEYHKPYFDTINSLFPELIKRNDYSFVSEHMIFNTKIMREIISKINSINTNNSFWLNIIQKINISEIAGSGFSEFETYGTYVEYHYPELYQINKWKSLRSENDWLDINKLDSHLYNWLGMKWDAISFDGWQSYNYTKYKIVRFFSYFFNYDLTIRIYNIIRKYIYKNKI